MTRDADRARPRLERLAGRVADRVLAPAPAERLAALRILVGLFAVVYLFVIAVQLWRVADLPARSFAPTGIVRVLLDEPLPPLAWRALVLATLALAPAFLFGFAHRVLAPLFAAALTIACTYRSSWGLVFHTENLLVLHVIILALAPAADARSLDARGRPTAVADACYAWPVRLMAAVTVLTYLLAGIAKLRIAGLEWATGAELRDQVAIDNARKYLLGSTISPIAAPFLEHPRAFVALAIASLTLELGAPLALLHRRIAAAWALGAWAFHVGVVALMAIVFPYPLAGIAFAPLFRAERLVDAVIARVRARRAR